MRERHGGGSRGRREICGGCWENKKNIQHREHGEEESASGGVSQKRFNTEGTEKVEERGEEEKERRKSRHLKRAATENSAKAKDQRSKEKENGSIPD
jgi:hypothetical protein